MRIKKKNKLFLIILFVIFISIGLGYSYLSTSLGIDIGLKISKRRTIYINNVEIINGSITAIEAPVADKMTSNLYLNVPFSNISDFYSFNVYLKNDTIKSYMLNDIVVDGLSSSQKDLFDINIYYENGEVPEENDLFYDASSIMKFEIKSKSGITSIGNEILSINISINYVDSTSNALFSPYYYLRSFVTNGIVDFSSTSVTSGIYQLEETKNDNYPVYFYRGNVTNNNLLFNNKCWKIMRNTDTRGIKLIYAGLPNSSGQCSNSNATTALSSSAFNENPNSISSIGYMYGDVGTIESFSTDVSFSYPYSTRTNTCGNTSYYFGSGYSSYRSGNYCYYRYTSYGSSFSGWTNFSTSNNQFYSYYIGSSSTSSCPAKYPSSYGSYYVFTYSSVYNSSSSCNNIRYYYVTRTSDDYNTYIYFSSDYTDNGDGTYTLNSPSSIRAFNWYNSSTRSSYMDMYTCTTLTNSSTCNGIMKVNSGSSSFSVNGTPLIKYGNDVVYENGMYTLVDVVDSFTTDQSVINEKYHYTCLGSETTCEEVSYIIGSGYKITLSGGDKLNSDFIEKLFANNIDSSIKAVVDEWYSTEMLNSDSLIEDTIYCNDRSFDTGSLAGKDVPVGSINFGYGKRTSPSLTCPLKRDSFSKSTSIGNGKLTYPVGLITHDEMLLSGLGGSSYLGTSNIWTMTPNFYNNYPGVYVFRYFNSTYYPNSSNYVRPVVSLKYGVKFFGSGTPSNPYKVRSSFVLAGKSYYYEPGMTWEQWVNSDYNTDNFLIQEFCGGQEHFIKHYNGNIFVSDSANAAVPSDLIDSSKTYSFNGVVCN